MKLIGYKEKNACNFINIQYFFCSQMFMGIFFIVSIDFSSHLFFVSVLVWMDETFRLVLLTLYWYRKVTDR